MGNTKSLVQKLLENISENEATCRFKIEDVSTLTQWTCHEPTKIRGFPYYVTVSTCTESDEDGHDVKYLVVYLLCNVDSDGWSWCAVTTAELRVINQKLEGEPSIVTISDEDKTLLRLQHITKNLMFNFHNKATKLGFKLCRFDELTNPANGFVVNDSIVVEAFIHIADKKCTFIDDVIGNLNRTRAKIRSFTIPEISHLATVETTFQSPTFVVRRHSWRIDVMCFSPPVVDNDEKKYLAIGVAHLEQNSSCRAKGTIVLVSYANDVPDLAVSFERDFDGLDCIDNLKFIEWETLFDKAKHYVEGDTITIRLDIEVLESDRDVTVVANAEPENPTLPRQPTPFPRPPPSRILETASLLRLEHEFRQMDDIKLIEYLKQHVNTGKPTDRYELETRGFDEGGFGKVFRATVKQNRQKMVAIKMIELAKLKQQKHYSLMELEIMRRNEHPNVLGCIDAYLMNNHLELWIVMDYLDGGNLHDLIEKSRTLSEDHIATISREILKGLEFLHTNRVVHRDMKGSNVLLSKSGLIKITDFGFSSFASDEHLKKSALGTPAFMAPEIIRQEQYGVKVDIYAVGVIIFMMIDKRSPHQNNPMQQMSAIMLKKPIPVPDTQRRISKGLSDILHKCLQSNPSDRATATDLLKHDFIQNAKSPSTLIQLIRGAS